MPSPLEFGQYLRGLFLGFWVVVFFGIFWSDFFVDFGVFSSYFSFFSGLFFFFFYSCSAGNRGFFPLEKRNLFVLKSRFFGGQFFQKNIFSVPQIADKNF
ncbi:hypothetical protein [Apibacter mensalis]|uniref:hypothetical protein n=1 Tax=Apibacter mensalis TaxID=1586267 RepID=UPI0026EE384B|nr:hypothetical protein [Apibacter mensalis]